MTVTPAVDGGALLGSVLGFGRELRSEGIPADMAAL